MLNQTEPNSNALFEILENQETDVLRVVFHSGFGTLLLYRPLMQALAEQNLGTVVGVAVLDFQKYLQNNPETLIADLADDYAQRLANSGYQKFQLIGHCMGGLIAAEVGTRLQKRNLTVENLVLIDAFPTFYAVKEPLIEEAVSLTALGLDFEKAGLKAVSNAEFGMALYSAFENSHCQEVPAPIENYLGDSEADRKVKAMISQMRSQSMEQRYASYAEKAGVPVENVAGTIATYTQATKGAMTEIHPCSLDVRFIRAKDFYYFIPGVDDKAIALWQKQCSGRFDLYEVEGDHFGCITMPSGIQKVAEIAREGCHAE
ncbi:MAG: alpha/beta fold hydrolase [Ruminococcus sp.]|nr:alpha/beta fold hydrolase [Ruminococcus sp.]